MLVRRLFVVLVALCLLSMPGLGMSQTVPINSNIVLYGHLNWCSPTTASGTTYACALGVAPGAYTTGGRYSFKADVANTGAATINFSSLGPRSIVKVQGGITTPLAANDIRAGQMVDLDYDGTNMQMVSPLGNAPTGADPTTVTYRTTAKNATSTLATTDGPVIACTATANVELTLPTTAGTQSWFHIVKVDSGAGQCVVRPTATQRINGIVDGTIAAVSQWEAVEVWIADTATPNWHGVVTVAPSNVALLNTQNTWGDGVKQVFNPNATTAGFNVGSHTADPSTPANGDLWYNSGTPALRAHINGTTVSLGAGGGGLAGTTGFVLLWPGTIFLPDGTAGNVFATTQAVKSGTAGPTNGPILHFQELVFDPATDWHAFGCFDMPSDYASGGTLRIKWKRNAGTTAQNVVWKAGVAALTPGGAEVPNSKAMNTMALSAATAAGTTTNALRESTITLTMDSAAAQDYVCIGFGRDADAGTDTLADAAGVVSVKFEYTR